MRQGDLQVLLQAMENVGNTYGGNTKILLHNIVNEVKRLQRYQEDQANRTANQRFKEAEKHKKITGEWPAGYGDRDDDIPF